MAIPFFTTIYRSIIYRCYFPHRFVLLSKDSISTQIDVEMTALVLRRDIARQQIPTVRYNSCRLNLLAKCLISLELFHLDSLLKTCEYPSTLRDRTCTTWMLDKMEVCRTVLPRIHGARDRVTNMSICVCIALDDPWSPNERCVETDIMLVLCLLRRECLSSYLVSYIIATCSCRVSCG